MRLASIVGQDRVVLTLRESLKHGRLHHALVFTGQPGIGKRTTAFALAAQLLCTAGGDDACGECDSCAQVAAASHPDLTVVEIPEKKKSILIQQIRDLQAALARRALIGPRKVAIIDNADTLTLEAQNAFLKTLEEPPAGSLLVLVAASASALLPTVRSRCQQLAFSPLPEDEVIRLLVEEHGIDPEEATHLARYAEGSLGTALSLTTEGLAETEAYLGRILNDWQAGDYRAVQKAAEDVSTPIGMPLLLRMLRRRLRDAAEQEGPDRVLRALSAARAAWQSANDLDRHANRTLTLERMWLEIGRALSP